MASKIGGVFIEIGAQTTPLFKALSKAEKGLKSSAASLQKIGSDLSLSITAPLALMGGAAFKMASDYEESLNKVRVAFGNSAGAVESFSETTLKNIGLAGGSALEMASLFGDMATSMGISQKDAAGLSTSLVTLAGDLASFKNISIGEAQTALSGIFTGETESLKRLGVVMLDSTLQAFALTQGITKQYKEFTQAEKVQLRYAYVMNATKNAQGDFANTSGGAANQMRTFQESLKQLSATFGSVLLPLLTPVIKKANEMLMAFQNLTEGQKKTIIAFAAVAAAIGPLIIVGAQIVSAFATIVGAMKVLATASKATGVAMSFSLGPISLILVGIGVAAAALIYYWDDLNEYFKKLYVSSEAFRGVMGGLKLMFDILKAAVLGVIDVIVALYKSWLNVIGVLSGDINPLQAFKNIKDEFYKVGKGFGENVVKGFKDANTSDKLAQLQKITGIQSPSGDRSASFKKLRDGKSNIPDVPSPINPLGNLSGLKSGEIKTLDQQISALQERIKQLSIQYQTKPTDNLLKNINSEISKLKEKEGILANSEALIKKLSGVPPTFVIKGSLDFPLDDIKADVSRKLAEIDANIALGLETDGIDSKIAVWTAGIKEAFANTGDITDPLIKDFQSKINAIKPPTFKIVKGGLFDFESADIFDDLKKKLATIDLKASVGLDIDVKGDKKGAIYSAISELAEQGTITADVMAKINAELTKIGENPGLNKAFSQISKGLDIAAQALGPLDSLFTQLYANQTAALDEKTAREKAGIENSILSEEEKAKRLKIVDDRAAQQKAVIAKKQAEQNKKMSLFNATVSGFEAVVRAYAAGGLPLGIVVGALTAANIAAIASAPIPSLAIGTNYVKSDGLAKLHKGEAVVPARHTGHFTQGSGMMGGGSEPVTIRNGDIKIVTDYNIQMDRRLAGVA